MDFSPETQGARRLWLVRAPIAQPLECSQQEEQEAEGQAHHGDDEGHPAGVGVGALRADSAEDEFGEEGEEDSGGEGVAAPFQ